MLSEGRPRRTFNDEEADMDSLGLGAVAEDGMDINIAASGNFFPRKAINWFIVLDHGSV